MTKVSRRYVVFLLIMAVALFIKLNNWSDRYVQVEPFRGARLEEEVFYPIMAKNLNGTGALSLYVSGRQQELTYPDIVFDTNLVPMMNLDNLMDQLSIAAFKTSDNTVLVLVGDEKYLFTIGSNTYLKDQEEFELSATPFEMSGQCYLGIEDICHLAGYGYNYNEDKYTVNVHYVNPVPLPEKFDLRDLDRVGSVRHQGSTSTCWAYASIGAMESALRPRIDGVLSVNSMIQGNSYNLVSSPIGGNYTMALAYLLAWQGPVAESSHVPIIHLQEAQFYNGDDIEAIKRAVYQHGGVTSSIYTNISPANINKSEFFNPQKNAYCYTGDNGINHDVVIIGWDDMYSKDNFAVNVPIDGAFICQNSWGINFGEDGIFYVSYCDANIGSQSVSYTGIDTNNTYGHIYQADLCGWVGQMGYNKESAFGANVYVARNDENIAACGFYCLGPNTRYKVYFVQDYHNEASLANRVLVASGKKKNPGYYTIKFPESKSVQQGENFAVVVELSTPNYARPLAIEYPADEKSKAVDLTDGYGFVSSNGLHWDRVEEVAGGNLCIKVYSNDAIKLNEEIKL